MFADSPRLYSLVPTLALMIAPGCASGFEACPGNDCPSWAADTDGPDAGSVDETGGPGSSGDDGDADSGTDPTTDTGSDSGADDSGSEAGGDDGGGPVGSCESRCEATYDSAAACQCDGGCFTRGDCCDDIQVECPWICGGDEHCSGSDICVESECQSPYGHEWRMRLIAVEGLDCTDEFGGLELEYLAWMGGVNVAYSPSSNSPGWPTYAPSIGIVSGSTEFQIDFWEDDPLEDDYKGTFCWRDLQGNCAPIPAEVLFEGEYTGVWTGGPMIRIEFERVE